MEDKYDIVVLGTGLTECVISGLLSVSGFKVLHMDRNGYYGGESASLNLNDIYKKFEGEKATPDKEFGKSRDWNVDLIPKFLMASGKLIKILRAAGVKNLDFTLVEGSYVFKTVSGKGRIHKIPATLKEVAVSPLMGFWEKGRCKKILSYVLNYDLKDEKTHLGYNLKKMTMLELYKKYGVNGDTQDFLGHGVALHTSDEYLKEPALGTVMRLKLYYTSLDMFGKSPYVYPLYGLGELPQVFARLCAVYGGTYMLRKPIDKIHYNQDGRVSGVESEGQTVKCNKVVGDPSYFTDRATKTGKIIRVICFLSNPIGYTNNSKSTQIVLPQKQLNRKSDIYITLVSYTHQVCSKGKFVAIIAANVETNTPEKEIAPALKLLGQIDKKFINIVDTYVPKGDGSKDGVFMSKSFDATSHFESCSDDILSLFKRITGKDYDFSKSKEEREKENKK